MGKVGQEQHTSLTAERSECVTNSLTVQIIRQGHQNTPSEQTDTAHHRAQFISRHLNIPFKVLRSCNLVVPRWQTGGLGLHSEDGGARERSHAATVSKGKPATSAAVVFAKSNSIFPAVPLGWGASWFQALWNVIHQSSVLFRNIYLFRSGERLRWNSVK